jgi:hypothetical protein
MQSCEAFINFNQSALVPFESTEDHHTAATAALRLMPVLPRRSAASKKLPCTRPRAHLDCLEPREVLSHTSSAAPQQQQLQHKKEGGF